MYIICYLFSGCICLSTGFLFTDIKYNYVLGISGIVLSFSACIWILYLVFYWLYVQLCHSWFVDRQRILGSHHLDLLVIYVERLLLFVDTNDNLFIICNIYVLTIMGFYAPSASSNSHTSYVCLMLFIGSFILGTCKKVCCINHVRNQIVPTTTDVERMLDQNVGSAPIYFSYTFACEWCNVPNATNMDCSKCTCGICLESMNQTNVYAFQSCSHEFHTKCVDKYLDLMKSNQNDNVLCPICRVSIVANTNEINRSIHSNSMFDTS